MEVGLLDVRRTDILRLLPRKVVAYGSNPIEAIYNAISTATGLRVETLRDFIRVENIGDGVYSVLNTLHFSEVIAFVLQDPIIPPSVVSHTLIPIIVLGFDEHVSRHRRYVVKFGKYSRARM